MNSEERPVLMFDYRQSISTSASGKSWSETMDISLSLCSSALSSGWYRKMFGKDAKSFVLLMALAMHGRPLARSDLRLLVSLGMAQESDEGRLYARVTDTGLADELGMHRDTIARCAETLSKLGLIETVRIPENLEFRDSHGMYAGAKIYLIAGDLEGRLKKSIQPRAENTSTGGSGDKSGLEKTGDDGAEKSAPDPIVPESEEQYDETAEKSGTGSANLEPKSAQNALHRGGKPSGFAEKFRINMLKKKKMRRRQPTQDQPLLIAPELQGVVQVVSAAGMDVDAPVLARLTMMVSDIDPMARSAQSSGAEWVRAALQLGLGVASQGRLLNYASAVLNDWKMNGRPTRRRQRSAGGQSASTSQKSTTHQAIENYLLHLSGQKEQVHAW